MIRLDIKQKKIYIWEKVDFKHTGDLMWPLMTLEVTLHNIKNLCLKGKVSIELFYENRFQNEFSKNLAKIT